MIHQLKQEIGPYSVFIILSLYHNFPIKTYTMEGGGGGGAEGGAGSVRQEPPFGGLAALVRGVLHVPPF